MMLGTIQHAPTLCEVIMKKGLVSKTVSGILNHFLLFLPSSFVFIISNKDKIRARMISGPRGFR
jgi:hypothetical protein